MQSDYEGAASADGSPSRIAQFIAFLPILPFLGGLGLVLVSIGTFVFQIVHWLKTGDWQGRTFEQALVVLGFPENFHLTWVIPDKVLQVVLHGSQSFWLLIFGAIIFYISNDAAVKLEEWSKRKTKGNLIPLTDRQKKAWFFIAVWAISFPTLLCVSDGSFKNWFEMFGVGIMLAFYIVFAILIYLDRKDKKAKNQTD